MSTTWWLAYRCPTPDGVVLDVRLECQGPGATPPPVTCPLCRGAMEFAGRWEADTSGYGSRSDSDLPTNLVRAAAALERERCARACETIAGRYGSGFHGDAAHECAEVCRAEGRPT